MRPAQEEAFDSCERLARSHYENFPVGWFIPKAFRKYIYVLYAFARTADDIVDENIFADPLSKLQELEHKLDQALLGKASEPLFVALAETFQKTTLPPKLLKDLLVAFRMDVTKKRYRDYKELENYCVYSANPVGRLVLLLFGYDDPSLLTFSDKICTGIQLVNHWQDVAVDLAKDRVYLPEEDLKKFHYTYEDLFHLKQNEEFRCLMRFEIARTRSLFYEGKPLLKALERRLRWQVSLMWLGPMKILDKIEEVDFDIFHQRPSLSKRELFKLFVSLLAGRF